jgi:hypothetical protein
MIVVSVMEEMQMILDVVVLNLVLLAVIIPVAQH